MKRKPSLLSFHLVINPELWVILNWTFNEGIFIFTIQFWFIIIQMTRVDDNDIYSINRNVNDLNSRSDNSSLADLYAPGKIRVECLECGSEESIYENEQNWKCPNCLNSDPNKIVVYTNPKK